MTRLTRFGVVVAALTAVMASAPASAITYDKLAFLTFNGPVQVPGATLNAGTYRFRLANPDTSRNVLVVLSHDGAIVHSMFQTRPDSRPRVTDDPTVSFLETPAGVTPAVKSLFYGGEHRGYEFVWGKGEPNMIPKVTRQPEITYERIPAAVPEVIAEPEARVAAAPVAEPVAAEPVAAAEPAQEPAELPRTASPLPFVALGGLSSLLAGLGLLRRRNQG